MKLLQKYICVAMLLLFLVNSAWAQKSVIISGLVADSVSMAALSGVNIKIKSTNRGTSTSDNGLFSIIATDRDTLILSLIGYKVLSYPLWDNETDILIRLTEEVRMLKEVITRATPILEIMVKKEPRYTKSQSDYVRTLSLAEGISSPFTYFSKEEKEKRKLVKMREENKKIKTYVEIVNDPTVKSEIIRKYLLTEKDYYEILAKFNKQNQQALYLNNSNDIKELLFAFFKNNSK